MAVLGASFAARMTSGPPVLLDGALGTELERRGVTLALPLWSTHALEEAPREIERIHRDYADAGAEVLTAASFRTQRRTLERAGRSGADAARLTATAVQLARAAAPNVLVAGSAPPLEDCYRPDLVPEERALEREHREHIDNLAAAGVDGIAVETMNCVREARVAARASADTGLPFWVSFVVDADACLLSGETLASAIEAVAGSGPAAVGVNCVPAAAADACLSLLSASGLSFCVYANLGAPLPDGSFHRGDGTPRVFAAHAKTWLDAGARMIGGCCGTTPDHVRALAELLDANA